MYLLVLENGPWPRPSALEEETASLCLILGHLHMEGSNTEALWSHPFLTLDFRIQDLILLKGGCKNLEFFLSIVFFFT